MQSFIEEVIADVYQKHDNISDVIFILPSKRAGTFLRNALAKITVKTLFSPEIYSIETFVEKLSGITYTNNTQQLFQLYSTYLKNTPGEKDSFYTFTNWGQTLLQDFIEIDRHLINPTEIFSNLSAILEIDHWSPEQEKTKLMEDYLHFWKNIEPLYHSFNKDLLAKNQGHQGLVYKQACEKLNEYQSKTKKTHVYIGFNAMNTAESHIIQTMLSNSDAQIYWDIDTHFLEDPIHDASYFIRQYRNNWEYFKKNTLKGVSKDYNNEKDIKIIGVPKNVSQAKYVGALLKTINEKDSESIKNTAVVLGDETLLNPILNAVPQEIDCVNITMGYPLHKTAIASLFEQFLALYINKDNQGWYHKNITDFLSHPFIQLILTDEKENLADLIIQEIKSKNLTYITAERIHLLISDNSNITDLLFFKDTFNTLTFVKKCLNIILEIKIKVPATENSLTMEYLYRFHNLFNQIANLVTTYSFITDIKSLEGLYKELLSSESLDFSGDPLEGLQIMGMLESRNLDFETIIITSVNEGILPAGKSNNSFIPYDLKINFDLPTYKEKDAVYTYHFYRLMQRAKNIYILYNTEPDVIEGGEKSRLITQLLTDPIKSQQITEIIAAPKIRPTTKTLETISKDPQLMKLIELHAKNGFSPSSLSNYIRNPIDFYKQHLLNIKDTIEVEETLAANTFGTIIHDTLEDLYTPFLGIYLTELALNSIKSNIKNTVVKHFKRSYSDSKITSGKNLIAYHVIIRYIENFINLEIKDIKQHTIKILALEENLKMEINIPGIDFPLFIKGKLDRIDEIDGITRIIDYKTGKVTTTQVEIVDWQEITTDYDFSKAFQLLCYALMYKSTTNSNTFEAGIISFKNLNAGLMKFAVKDRKGGRIKDSEITSATLALFTTQLHSIISEISNPNLPFIEKKI